MTHAGDTEAPHPRLPIDGLSCDEDWLTVGQVAQRFDVSVRTLHHYDGVGLLTPSDRSDAGYRRYTRADLDRLAQIVVYRRLGFALAEVADLLLDDAPVAVHLHRQRQLVATRIDELAELAAALDAALERTRSHPLEVTVNDVPVNDVPVNDAPLTDAELKDLFGDGFDESYQQEAEQRWGESDAWKQSKRRTATYGKAEWQAVKDEGQALTAALAEAKRAGHSPDSVEAMDAVEAHRRHISRWFYDCPTAMHRGLGDMYVADPRFTATYDDLEPGLAAWVRDAVHANADRQDARA
jgi:MerR family transcriptional regulator, thiopeptide resistance regulator